jgi:uncharacterized repeat protein (TIGR01451 family)
MKTSGIRVLGIALCFLAGQALVGNAHAQATGPIQITNNVYQEILVQDADGKPVTKRVPAAKVVPGTDVVYEIAYSNTGKDTATNVAINSPVPAALVFLGDESTPVTEVSVDGGKAYGKLAELTVAAADGKPRPAQAADVTNLRWILATLMPGAKGKVSFRARVR